MRGDAIAPGAEVQAYAAGGDGGQRHRRGSAIDDQRTGTRVRETIAHERLQVLDGIRKLAESAAIARDRKAGRAAHRRALLAAVHRIIGQRERAQGRAVALFRQFQRLARQGDRAVVHAGLPHRDRHVAIHAGRFSTAAGSEIGEGGVEGGAPVVRVQDIAGDVRDDHGHAAVDLHAILDAIVGADLQRVAVAHHLLVAQVGLDGHGAAAGTRIGHGDARQQGRRAWIHFADQVERRAHHADVGAADADAGQQAAERRRGFGERHAAGIGAAGHLFRICRGHDRQRGYGSGDRCGVAAGIAGITAAAAATAAAGQEQGGAKAQQEELAFHRCSLSGMGWMGAPPAPARAGL